MGHFRDLAPQLVLFGHRESLCVPRFLLKDSALMHVPNKARRCVIFLGSVDAEGVFTPRATAFLVVTLAKGANQAFPAIVTAEHVISGMQTRGMRIYCRVNLKDGTAAVEPMDSAKWWFHPDTQNLTDVAVAPFGVNLQTVDHDYIPLPEETWEERDPFKRRGPGLGDEVFMVGLFRSHYGKQRNEPIIRIGNIAAMPGEPVFTKYAGYIEAHLIEARSISGLSGSPVFVNVPEGLPPGTNFIPDVRYRGDPEEINWMSYHFFGLMHGHFDLEKMAEDSVVEDANQSGGINTGVGVVIPAKKVLETLYQPELKKEREELIKTMREKKGATPDLDTSAIAPAPAANSSDDANPNHKEDFTRLLGAAAKTKRPAD